MGLICLPTLEDFQKIKDRINNHKTIKIIQEPKNIYNDYTASSFNNHEELNEEVKFFY